MFSRFFLHVSLKPKVHSSRSFSYLGSLFSEVEPLPTYKFIPNSSLTTILAPFSYGQKKPGVESGPRALLESNLVSSIQAITRPVTRTELPTAPSRFLWEDVMIECCETEFLKRYESITNDPNDQSGHIRRPRLTGSATEIVHHAAAKHASTGRFVLTLGGDHSLALGSVSAMQSIYKDVGLIWVDAHPDINIATTTPSGNLHGLPVSFLLGLDQGRDLPGYEWTKQNRFTYLKPNRVVYIALRDVDPGERRFIKSLNIKAFSMREVQRHGIDTIIKAAIAHFDPTIPIHCSFDIDALDPTIAASTGTPVMGGLTLSEGKYLAESIARTGRLVGFDLMEVNPSLGSTSQVDSTLNCAKEIILSALGSTYLC